MNITIARKIQWGLALGAVTVFIAGCGNSQKTQTADGAGATATALTAAGATFPYPLYAKWFNAYNQKTGIQINYQPVGSGAGIKQIKNQTVDFGASDAPVKDAELKTMPKELLQIPTVAGAVVVAYNLPSLKAPLKLDGETLADIYLGKIKKWNNEKIAALNAGASLPDTGIVVAHRSDGSGTSFIFTSYLSAISPTWQKQVGTGKSVSWPTGTGAKGNSGVAGVVKQTPGALGYVELAYAQQNELPMVSLRNQAGNFVAPSVDATTAAIAGSIEEIKKDVRASIVNAPGEKAYPIAGITYLLVYKDSENEKTIKTFLEWAMTTGQQMAKELYYAPLPEEMVALNQEVIQSIH